MSGVDVIIDDLATHPVCIHGPTLLFSREIDGKKRSYYACSACRDRKKCSFFVWKDEADKYVNKKVDKQIFEHQRSINHRKLFIKLNQVKAAPEHKRLYCHTCQCLDLGDESHMNHDVVKHLTDVQLLNPTELLKPLEDPKKEAQYLFSKKCVSDVVNILRSLNYKNVICIGTPRLAEHIFNDLSLDINAILLDFDSRFHSFFGPLQFCWYNIFNNHFFKQEGKEVFKDFLQSVGAKDTIIVTDPPFGGRIEPILHTLKEIERSYKTIHSSLQLPILWFFPYFMESHVVNADDRFKMLDYKVDYDNHSLFQSGDKGRKFGSPVRIFTNLKPGKIILPSDFYKHCKLCKKWVSMENKHCKYCNDCTSKDGRTYVHCALCERCVKPSWSHCDKCNKCAVAKHNCQDLPFKKTCFHCNESGHKKRDCPKVNHDKLRNKRKLKITKNKPKKIKI